MTLSVAQIRRLAKAGATVQVMTVVAKMMADCNGDATTPKTEAATPRPLRVGMTSTERSRKFRQKRRETATAIPVALPVAATENPPAPPSLLPLEANEIVVLKEAKKKKGDRIARGHRLPDDFVPDASCEALARELKYTQTEWKARLDNFFDYWRAVPGQRGCKIDWQATYRNALRNGPRNGGNGHGKQRANAIQSSLDAVEDAIDQRIRDLAQAQGSDTSHPENL
jgi:hypothetical protein